ncbi:MAG TPA: GDSL-type esterase/lipase family protein [Chloroflexia bacterium]|nr:GDSL-type esterase/lipase family protein [Chloroflexia bacterium]
MTSGIRLVGLGDSLIRGAGDAGELGWLGRLTEALKPDFPELEMLNRGVGGDTTRHILAWIEQDCLGLEPDLVILGVGVNDSRRRVSLQNQCEIPLDLFEQNLNEIILRLKRAGAGIIVSGMIPVDDRGATYKEDKQHFRNDQFRYEAIIEKVAALNKVTYLDHFNRCLAFGDARISSLLLDGVHPNSQGYAEMAQASIPVVASQIRMLSTK